MRRVAMNRSKKERYERFTSGVEMCQRSIIISNVHVLMKKMNAVFLLLPRLGMTV